MRQRIAALTALLTLCVPATAALAADGGVSPGDPIPGANAGWLTASAAGVSLKAPLNALGGKTHVATGSVGRGRTRVSLERQSGNGSWAHIGAANSTSSGSYRVSWNVNVFGPVKLRVTAAGHAGQPSGTIMSFRRANATIFGGPSEYQAAACGGRIAKGTMGLAHKTLPCGTLVRVSYGQRSIVLPVIDRGPYRGGYTWDVTYDAAKYLRMNGSAVIGYLVSGRDGT